MGTGLSAQPFQWRCGRVQVYSRSSFIAGIKQYLQTIWHDANTELPNDGEWCLLRTTSGFRLATRRMMQSGVYKWWFMDYSMYDGKGLEQWAYVSDLVLYK